MLLVSVPILPSSQRLRDLVVYSICEDMENRICHLDQDLNYKLTDMPLLPPLDILLQYSTASVVISSFFRNAPTLAPPWTQRHLNMISELTRSLPAWLRAGCCRHAKGTGMVRLARNWGGERMGSKEAECSEEQQRVEKERVGRVGEERRLECREG